MITICFLSGLQEIVGQDELRLDHSGNLSDLLESLCDRYGENLCRLVFDSRTSGERSPFLKVLVNGVDVRELDPHLEGDETLFLFLPIAGG